jgi:hypothetical protein
MMPKVRNTIHQKPKVLKERRFGFGSFTTINRKLKSVKPVSWAIPSNLFSRENLGRQIPFILFLTFLGILYIANSYNAEKTIIEIGRTKRQIEELRFSYITTKSELMFHSKQSAVASKLSNSGVKESLVPPVKLYIKARNKNG